MYPKTLHLPNIVNIRTFLDHYKKFMDEVDSTQEPIILSISGMPKCVLIPIRDAHEKWIIENNDEDVEKDGV